MGDCLNKLEHYGIQMQMEYYEAVKKRERVFPKFCYGKLARIHQEKKESGSTV